MGKVKPLCAQSGLNRSETLFQELGIADRPEVVEKLHRWRKDDHPRFGVSLRHETTNRVSIFYEIKPFDDDVPVDQHPSRWMIWITVTYLTDDMLERINR
jgi:hypothetical protein